MIDRNKDIAGMRRQGKTYAEIGRKFGITAVRAHQICEKERIREKLEADPLHALIMDADRELDYSCGAGLVTRTYNVLRGKGVRDASSLSKVSLKEVAHMKNAGVKTVALTALAQEIARRGA